MGSAPQSRLELEDLWRNRVHEARVRYLKAREDLLRVRLNYAHGVPSRDGQYAVVKAQRIEIWALEAYSRAMKILHDLQVDGKLPPPDA